MPQLNSFAGKYTKHTLTELFLILDNPNDYQPEALQAVQAEIDTRQFSEAERRDAEEFVIQARAYRQLALEKEKVLDEKAAARRRWAFDLINPVKLNSEEPATIIRNISLLFIVVTAFQIYGQGEMIWFMLTDDVAEWDFSMIIYFLPMILAPVGAFLFWKRRRTGWVMLVVLTILGLGNAVVGAYGSIAREPIGNAFIDSILTRSPYDFIPSIFVFGAILFTLTRASIAGIYYPTLNIKRATLIVIAISAFLIYSWDYFFF